MSEAEWAPVSEPLPKGTALGPAGAFASEEDESRAFWRMRFRRARTAAYQTFFDARLRLVLILTLSVLLWAGLYWLFADGFWFLRTGVRDQVTHGQIVRAVFGMFFVALMVMLVFSSFIILYGGLFRAPEIALLFSMPARTARVFLHKFQEAVFLSSWAFLLLGSPMLIAYGVVARASWYYYPLLVPFMVSFVYIPAGIGALVCLLVVYWLPGDRRHVVLALVFAAGVVVAGGVWLFWSTFARPSGELLTPSWFREVLGRLQFSQRWLLPSWWLSSGLLSAARGAWRDAVMLLTVLIANALLVRQVAVWVAVGTYRAAYSALRARHTPRKRHGIARIDRLAFAVTAPFSRAIRLLTVKDLRIFRRDPVQWTQFLIFFGLLALYFLNIRRLSYSMEYRVWVNMISFLNLSVVGLLLSTFTTRFIFPMISLEGRRFWILGLLPIRRETILWGKFVFAVGGSIIPCSGLILLSDTMLQVSPMLTISHQVTCLILCVGLSGIAVGLGARLPNLREESPSRIAAGFGGTLNLVVSTLYIVAVVLMTAVPYHFYLHSGGIRVPGLLAGAVGLAPWLRFWLVAGTLGSVVLGVLATVIPLRIGFKAFRRLEF